jgi:hypothetical protein
MDLLSLLLLAFGSYCLVGITIFFFVIDNEAFSNLKDQG